MSEYIRPVNLVDAGAWKVIGGRSFPEVLRYSPDTSDRSTSRRLVQCQTVASEFKLTFPCDTTTPKTPQYYHFRARTLGGPTSGQYLLVTLYEGAVSKGFSLLPLVDYWFDYTWTIPSGVSTSVSNKSNIVIGHTAGVAAASALQVSGPLILESPGVVHVAAIGAYVARTTPPDLRVSQLYGLVARIKKAVTAIPATYLLVARQAYSQILPVAESWDLPAEVDNPFLHNWASAVRVDSRFISDVSKAQTGIKDKTNYTDNPVRRITVSYLNLEQAELSKLWNYLYFHTKSRMVHPLTSDHSTLTANVSGATVYCDETNRRFFPGARVILIHFEDNKVDYYEIGIISIISSGEITLESSLTKTFETGDRIYPLLYIEIDISTAGILNTDENMGVTFTGEEVFRYALPGTNPIGSISGFSTTFNNLPVFDLTEDNEIGKSPINLSLTSIGESVPVGLFSTIEFADDSYLSLTCQLTFPSRAKAFEFLRLFDYAGGRTYPFFTILPSKYFKGINVYTNWVDVEIGDFVTRLDWVKYIVLKDRIDGTVFMSEVFNDISATQLDMENITYTPAPRLFSGWIPSAVTVTGPSVSPLAPNAKQEAYHLSSTANPSFVGVQTATTVFEDHYYSAQFEIYPDTATLTGFSFTIAGVSLILTYNWSTGRLSIVANGGYDTSTLRYYVRDSITEDGVPTGWKMIFVQFTAPSSGSTCIMSIVPQYGGTGAIYAWGCFIHRGNDYIPLADTDTSKYYRIQFPAANAYGQDGPTKLADVLPMIKGNFSNDNLTENWITDDMMQADLAIESEIENTTTKLIE